MAFKGKDLFFGDDDDIYEKQKLDLFSSIHSNQKESTDFQQEKSELFRFCNQILSSYKIKENSDQILLDLDSLEEVVNHLSNIETKIIQFNIDNMIELNMQEFITEIVDKVCIQQYNINFQILTNLIHLVLIWSNGTQEQISTLFNHTFISYLFIISRSFFLKDSRIVGYSLKSIKNLFIQNFFPTEAIPEIMTELFLLLDQFLKPQEKINNVFLRSIKNVFLCFQAVLNQKKIKKLEQTDGLIVMTKRWIDFIQDTFYDKNNIYPFFQSNIQKYSQNPTNTANNTSYMQDESENDDFCDYDIMCRSLCSALRCMNDLVLLKKETANYFFDRNFMTTNLVNYLRSYNLKLKKNGLNTLLTSLTTVGSDRFTAWDFVDKSLWYAVENVVSNETDSDLKLILCKVIDSILYSMPTILQIKEEKERIKHQDIQQQQQQEEDENQDQKEEKNEDLIQIHHLENQQENDDNDDDDEERKELILIDDNDTEEEEEEECNCDSICGCGCGQFNLTHSPSRDLIYDMYECGVLSRVLSLSGSTDEPLDVRLAAILAIASNINIFSLAQMTYLIHSGAIHVFISTLEILDESQIGIVFNAIWHFLDYAERADRIEMSACVDKFDKSFADHAFEELMRNPLLEGKFDSMIQSCIDKLGILRDKTPIEQREKSRERRERKEMDCGDGDDVFHISKEYDEFDDGDNEN